MNQRVKSSTGRQSGYGAPPSPDTFFVDEDEEEIDDEETQMPRSVRRYTTDATHAVRVHRQGNRRVVVHMQPPPPPRRQAYYEEQEREQVPVKKKKLHLLVYIGIYALVVLAGIALLQAGMGWWQNKQDDQQYGIQRHFGMSLVLYPHDTPSNPTIVSADNFNGHIQVVLIPGGDMTKEHVLPIETVPNNFGNPPVTVSFRDMNGDGKLDMIIKVGDDSNQSQFLLYNNGTQFVNHV